MRHPTRCDGQRLENDLGAREVSAFGMSMASNVEGKPDCLGHDSRLGRRRRSGVSPDPPGASVASSTASDGKGRPLALRPSSPLSSRPRGAFCHPARVRLFRKARVPQKLYSDRRGFLSYRKFTKSETAMQLRSGTPRCLARFVWRSCRFRGATRFSATHGGDYAAH